MIACLEFLFGAPVLLGPIVGTYRVQAAIEPGTKLERRLQYWGCRNTGNSYSQANLTWVASLHSPKIYSHADEMNEGWTFSPFSTRDGVRRANCGLRLFIANSSMRNREKTCVQFVQRDCVCTCVWDRESERESDWHYLDIDDFFFWGGWMWRHRCPEVASDDCAARCIDMQYTRGSDRVREKYTCTLDAIRQAKYWHTRE